MAIIIYVILIAEADWVAIIVCFLMCFPIVYTNILAGLDSMGDELKEMASIYKLTDVQKVRYKFGAQAHLRAELEGRSSRRSAFYTEIFYRVRDDKFQILSGDADSDGVYTCRSCIEYRN